MRNPNTKCKICLVPVYKRPNELENGNVYCSKRCYGLSCRKEFTCPICDKVLLKGKHGKTCSKACANKNRTGIKYGNATLERSFRDRVIEAYGHKCMKCGYTLFVDAHHIIKRRQGGSHELENGIPLCKNHHAEAEEGYISVDELRELKVGC